MTTVVLGATSTPAASVDAGNVGTSAETASSGSSNERPTYEDSTAGGTTAGMMHRYGETAQANGTSNWSSMYEFMEFTVNDVAAFWSAEFAAAGYQAPQVSYTFPAPGETTLDACSGGPTNDADAFYCPADDRIVISQKVMTDAWNGDEVGPSGQTVEYGGDMPVAVAIAHEYAHNLQQELGLNEGQYAIRNTELHADCLAGIWTRSAASRNLLDPGDVEEGVWAMYMIGGGDPTSKGYHGSPDERMSAFALGYDTGSGASCDTVLSI